MDHVVEVLRECFTTIDLMNHYHRTRFSNPLVAKSCIIEYR